MIFGSPAYGQGGGNTQKRTVSGMVTDENDNPVSGATVIVQGTTTGTTTTAGKFTIQVTPASILEVKFLGYKTAEVKVGTQTNLTIKLETTSETIQDVVVTALGMTRERKSLGYSVGDIKGEAFEKVRELNVINSLAGREPGLIISQTAGGPSGSSHVEIRGSSMLTGNNQPLYVVDGMPIDNTNFGSANKDGGYDLGDGISSINPDDIENISVLKGPAASALYGSQAGNGVIMITTKKASSRKGQSLGVEINSTTTVEQQLTRFDDVQYIYGQGSNGRIYGTIDDRSNSSKSWGPKIDKNLKIWYFDNVLRPYTISNHGIEDFFRLGVTANNSITLNKIYKDAGIRLSYSDLRNRDIVPNSGMNRSTFTVRTNTKIGRKIDVDVKVNYVYEKVNNRPALAGDRNNEGKNLSSLPSTYDLYLLRDNYKDEEGKYYNWNGDVNRVNPYWIINEMSNTSKKNRLISSASISYKITDKLKFKLSGGADITEFSFEDFAPISTPSHESGYLKTQTNSNRTINADAVLTYSTNLGKNMSLVGTAGLNLYRVDNFQTTITGKDMAEPEIKKINSFSDKTIVESPYQRQINSAYAMVNLGYKNFAYLDVTVRADNTSTLINNTYVYPSVSGSFIFSELLPSSVSKILSFGKVRASWAEVGNDTSPYQMSLNYALYPHPVGGVSSGQISNSTVPNRDLKPTRTRSWEVGTELYFLNKRIVLDFTYYSQPRPDPPRQHLHQHRLFDRPAQFGRAHQQRHRDQAQHHSRKDQELAVGSGLQLRAQLQQGALAGRIADVRGGERRMGRRSGRPRHGRGGRRAGHDHGQGLQTQRKRRHHRRSDHRHPLGQRQLHRAGKRPLEIHRRHVHQRPVQELEPQRHLRHQSRRGPLHLDHAGHLQLRTLQKDAQRTGRLVSVRRRTPCRRTRNGSMESYGRLFGGWRSSGQKRRRHDQLGAQYPLLQPGKLLELHLQQHSPVLRAGQLLRQDPRNDAQLQLPAEDDRKGAGRTDPVVRSPKPADHLQERSEHRPRLQLQQRQRKRNRVRLAALAPQFRIQH